MTRFSTRPRSQRGEIGQAMVETLIIFWFAFSLLMVVIQIALIFNAQSVVKLAAMNAARTASVARLEDKMEEPVTLEHMVDQARKAAFLTIVPVIPGAHGQNWTDIGSLLGLFTAIPADLSSVSSVLGALKGGGTPVVAIAVEYLGKHLSPIDPQFGDDFFRVCFVEPRDPEVKDCSKKIEDFAGKIEFDDPARPAENVIKVVVEWDYPLLIPLADQIIYAYVNTVLYQGALAASGHVAEALRIQFGYQTAAISADLLGIRPPTKGEVWNVGWAFRTPSALGPVADAAAPWNLTGFRIPVRSSYVMRMNWDRGPNS